MLLGKKNSIIYIKMCAKIYIVSCLVVFAGELGEHIGVQLLVLLVGSLNDASTLGDLLQSSRILRINGNDAIEVGQCAVRFASLQAGLATSIKGFNVIRIDFEDSVALLKYI